MNGIKGNITLKKSHDAGMLFNLSFELFTPFIFYPLSFGNNSLAAVHEVTPELAKDQRSEHNPKGRNRLEDETTGLISAIGLPAFTITIVSPDPTRRR
jgi:hypothetical protein